MVPQPYFCHVHGPERTASLHCTLVATGLGLRCLRVHSCFAVTFSRSRPLCNQSSAKAYRSRAVFVSGGGSKEEEIGKFYPLCVQLLSGAMGKL